MKKRNSPTSLLISIYFIVFNLNSFAAESINLNHKNQALERTQVDCLIKQIPEQDLINIKILFETMFKFNELGFTLFGDKPASFCNQIEVTSSNFLYCDDIYFYTSRILEPYKRNFQNEWASWQKYKNLFKIDNFILVNESLGILLINKKTFVEIVSNNLNLFESTLKKTVDIDALLSDLEAGKGIFDLLSQNHELFGIVLGFGLHNSNLFQRRDEILSALDPYKIPYGKRDITTISPSGKYSSIQDELNDLWKILSFDQWDMHCCITDFNQVTFAADANHSETKYLRNAYEEQKNKIIEVFSKEDWFEQIILQLISN